MRILLNNLTALRQKTGIGHYVTELVHGLRIQQSADQFVPFPGLAITAAVRVLGSLKNTLTRARKLWVRAHADSAARSPSSGHARDWAAWYFRTFWARGSFDIYHEPNQIPFPCERPTIATVHDLSVLLHHDWHPADRVAYYEKHFEAGLARCDHLLTDSEFIRRQLIRTFAIAPTKVTCVPIGMRAGLRPMSEEEIRPVLRRLDLPSQYLLHVGTLEPRKNLLMLMRAFVELPLKIRERCPLVLAGGWGWNVAELAEYYHSIARHAGVRHLGYVDDRDLPALYNGARALVFPSHYEGFGLPPLEMMACGGAVLASTAGAVVETVGDHAHLLRADDLSGWRKSMAMVVTDDDWHHALQRGAVCVALPYTWQRCARETYRVYCDVLGVRQAAPLAA